MHADSSRLGHLLDSPVATVVKYSGAQHLLDDSHGLMQAADLKAFLCGLQEWAGARLAEAPPPGQAPAPSRQVRRQLERAARKASGGTAKDVHHGPAFTRAMGVLGELTLGRLVASDAGDLIAHGAEAADLPGFLAFIRDDAAAKIGELDGQDSYQVSHMYLAAAQGLAEENPECPGCCWRPTDRGLAFADGKISIPAEVLVNSRDGVLGVTGEPRSITDIMGPDSGVG